MQRIALTAAFLALIALGQAYAQTERAEIPIHQTILPDGAVRYSIPLRVGKTDIEAMYDTGATGLRILSGALRATDFTALEQPDQYIFAGGAELNGVIGRARLQIGSLSSPSKVPIHVIKAVRCVEALPNCPVSRVATQDYRIGGSGFPKKGFMAIAGTSFQSAEVSNPFKAMGVMRWIVELPQPGSQAPGRLLLNPTDQDVKDFMTFTIVSPSQSAVIPGCLLNKATHESLCGGVLLDSGTPGVVVESPGKAAVLASWQKGTALELGLQNKTGEKCTIPFTLGSSPLHTIYLDNASRSSTTRIATASPFFAFSVLFDARKGIIGLRKR